MKKSSVTLIWGIGTGVISSAFYQVLYATGTESTGLRYFNFLIIFLGLFIGSLQYRKANGGYLTFGEGFKTSFFMVLIIAVLSTISTLIDLQIHPDFIDNILAHARENMINKGYGEDQIEMSMHYVSIFTTPAWIAAFAVIFTLLFGTIISLIVAGLNSKPKPLFDDANETAGNETNV